MPFQPKANTVFRRVATRTVTFGQTEVVDLPRQYDLHSVVLHLHGTYQLSTAGSAEKSAGFAELISRVELFADGSKALRETSGALAALGQFPRGMNVVNDALDGSITTAQTVNTVFRLDLANVGGPRPKDSALHTAFPFMSLLQVKWSIDTALSLITAGSPVLNSGTTSLQVDVLVEELQEFNPQDNAEGRFMNRHSLQTLSISASNSAEIVKIPVGAFHRGAMIYARDENSDGVNTVVNNAKIRSGVNVRMDMPEQALRNKNRVDYMFPAANAVAGLYFADLMPSGSFKNLFDLRGASEAELVLDVTKPAGGNATIDVALIELVEQAPLT